VAWNADNLAWGAVDQAGQVLDLQLERSGAAFDDLGDAPVGDAPVYSMSIGLIGVWPRCKLPKSMSAE